MTAATEPRIIDLRTLGGPNKCDAVLGLFDSLEPAESLVVVSDHEQIWVLPGDEKPQQVVLSPIRVLKLINADELPSQSR